MYVTENCLLRLRVYQKVALSLKIFKVLAFYAVGPELMFVFEWSNCVPCGEYVDFFSLQTEM
jgi:hypothetical protein